MLRALFSRRMCCNEATALCINDLVSFLFSQTDREFLPLLQWVLIRSLIEVKCTTHTLHKVLALLLLRIVHYEL